MTMILQEYVSLPREVTYLIARKYRQTSPTEIHLAHFAFYLIAFGGDRINVSRDGLCYVQWDIVLDMRRRSYPHFSRRKWCEALVI
jgi:hypothetical protein